MGIRPHGPGISLYKLQSDVWMCSIYDAYREENYFIRILVRFWIRHFLATKVQLIPLFHTGHESPRINFFIRGDSWGFIKKNLQSWCSTIQTRFRYDVDTNIRGNRLNSAGIAQEFITISKITLEHAARKLKINYEVVKNMPNAARIWTRTNSNPRRFATIREIFFHDSYKKKAHTCLRGISSKMNVPRKAAVELILQLECWKQLLI